MRSPLSVTLTCYKMVINPIVVGMEIQVFTSGLYQPYGIYAGFVVLHYASHDMEDRFKRQV